MTFDNVYVNGALYDSFDSYSAITDVNFSKWKPNYSNVSIVGGAVEANLSNSVGRAHAQPGLSKSSEHPFHAG